MFTLVITEKGGAQKRMDFDKSEITIGRVQGNDVILPKGNVSKRHSRIVLKDNRFIVVDLKSTNGTYVNGRKITSPLVVKSGDKIYIGDFILTLEEAAGAGAGQGAPSAPPAEASAPAAPAFRSATAPPRSVPDPAPPPMMAGPMNGPGMGAPGMSAPPPMGGPPPLGAPSGPPSVVASPPAMPTPSAAPAPMGPPPMSAPMSAPMGAPMGGPMMGAGMGPPPMAAPMSAPMGAPMGPPPMGPPPLAAAPMGGAAPAAMGAPQAARRSGASPVPGPPSQRSPDRFPLEEEPSEEYSAAGGGAVMAAAAAPVRAVPPPASIGRGPGPAAMPAAPPAAAIAPAPNAGGAGARGPSRVPGPPVPSSGPMARGGSGAVPPLRPVPGGAGAGAAPQARQPAPPPSPGGPPNAIRAILDRVAQQIDVRSVDVAQLRDEGHWDRAERAISQAVERMAGEGALPPAADRSALARDALHEAVGLGALEELLADDAVAEIHVNGTEPIVVERDGRIETTERAFSSEDAIVTAVRRMLAPLGRDLTGPVVEARLADGTSVTALLAPVAARGAFVSLRRARRNTSTLGGLVATGALSQGVAELLEACMAARRNVLVTGSTASDAAPLVAALCAATGANERVVLVEPAPEIAAPSHVVTLEASNGADGASPVSVRQVLGAALRARADRLVVGDLRGAETRDAIEAAAGREGVLMSIAAPGPREGLVRLEQCGALAGDGSPASLRPLVAAAVHVVVGVARHADGVRRVTGVHVLEGASDGGYATADVFVFQSGGVDANGAIVGRWVPTGYVPPFVEQLRAAGVAVGNSMFRE